MVVVIKITTMMTMTMTMMMAMAMTMTMTMAHFFGRPQSTQTIGGVGATLINLGGAAAGLGTSLMPNPHGVACNISVAVSGQASCSRDGGLVEVRALVFGAFTAFNVLSGRHRA